MRARTWTTAAAVAACVTLGACKGTGGAGKTADAGTADSAAAGAPALPPPDTLAKGVTVDTQRMDSTLLQSMEPGEDEGS